MTEQSQDQAQETQVEEQSQDQVQTEETGEGNKPSLVEVNGEMVDLDELKKGYMRQSDYTRKTQQLAQAKSKSLDEIKESNPDLYEQVVKPLQEAGIATKTEMLKLSMRRWKSTNQRKQPSNWQNNSLKKIQTLKSPKRQF